MKTFGMKTVIHFGDNALDRLREIPYKRVLIITDPFVVQSKMIDLITEPLAKGGIEYDIFSNVVPDAPVDKIADGVKKFLSYQPEAVIAVGGGSVEKEKCGAENCEKTAGLTLTADELRCIIAVLYTKQIETVDLKERLMAISITEASELKKAILENFGVTLHFHDGCGGQYFTLDERNDEIKQFVESYFDKKGMTVTFIARGTQFSVGGNNA